MANHNHASVLGAGPAGSTGHGFGTHCSRQVRTPSLRVLPLTPALPLDMAWNDSITTLSCAACRLVRKTATHAGALADGLGVPLCMLGDVVQAGEDYTIVYSKARTSSSGCASTGTLRHSNTSTANSTTTATLV